MWVISDGVAALQLRRCGLLLLLHGLLRGLLDLVLLRSRRIVRLPLDVLFRTTLLRASAGVIRVRLAVDGLLGLLRDGLLVQLGLMFLGFAFFEEGAAAAEEADADEEETANDAADDYACDLAAGEAVV